MKHTQLRAFVVSLLLALMAGASSAQMTVSLEVLGTYDSGIRYESAAEIVAYDASNQRLLVVNSASEGGSLDYIDISDPANPTLFNTISMDEFGDGANSVAVSGDLVAVAVQGDGVDANGTVVFFDLEGNVLNQFTVGVLPDMVTFTPNGQYALVANEGEPSDDYSIDPEGSVSIISLGDDVANQADDESSVTNVSFEVLNDAELDLSVRIFGPDASVAQDLEPEYIVVSDDSSTAYVSAQENNAMIVIDIEAGTVVDIHGYGFKDYSQQANAIDPSNRDGGVNIRPVPVFGMYQPDAIAYYNAGGLEYIVTANEGDARDYDTFSEEERIADITLDEAAFPNAAELQAESNLGRLLITTTLGDSDGDGAYEALYSYGARSFSIFSTDGNLIYDSGNDFALITSTLPYFNGNGLTPDFDGRSDDKGAEPEALTLGELDGRTLAFIGLERTGGIMVYDITDPFAVQFLTYTNNVNPDGDVEDGTAGDVGPEGLVYISPDESPNGEALLVVSNEVSGTTTVYQINR